MTFDTRPSPQDWLAAVVIGAGSGAVVLGIGGRSAMRGIALLSGTPPGFSLGGTTTVVLLGALAGLAGAVVLSGLRWLLPRQRLGRGVAFWLFLLLVTLRGLRPLDAQRLLLFMPLVLVYGSALQALWCRVRWRRRAAHSAPAGAIYERFNELVRRHVGRPAA